MLSKASSSTSSLIVCVRCLRSAPLSRTLHVSTTVARKFDESQHSHFYTRDAEPASGSSSRSPQRNRNLPQRSGSFKGPLPQRSMKGATPDRVRARLSSELRRWIRAPTTLDRLRVMGLEDDQSRRLLNIFAEEEPSSLGGWFPPSEDEHWQMQRIVDGASDLQAAVDGALTRRFLQWTLDTIRTPGRRIIPPQACSVLESVYESLDYTHPHSLLPFRRARMINRKIHMHVGPTNSGKTHNALRALAAAKHGVYASPLRLLAHEVFDRLNKGRICPAGMDLTSNQETWKRPCNLITGEEVRTVDESAGLLSCTIEMLKFSSRFDVAVVDEIQMLADPDRGGAWSAAVLGLHATEVHLCGEEAAVPLVKKMLAETGDEVIVHKYERLTPLITAPHSLKSDLKNIEKGDCIVSFSRTKLFEMKERVEKATGMRCAIIYGRLPPEVRAEQAELFNTPGNGYDVLVGSDAIGMGLNLKIKRIVFETVTKYDGLRDNKLSLSQLKQIAGRAGRYGLHEEDSLGGVVTTLHEADLPTVRKAVANPVVPHTERAVVPNAEMDMLTSLSQAVRPNTGLRALFDLQRMAGRIPPFYTFPLLKKEHLNVFEAVDGADGCAGDAVLHERVRVLNAPIQWRDISVCAAAKTFLQMYALGDVVPFKSTCKSVNILSALEEVKAMQANAKESKEQDNAQRFSSLQELLIELTNTETPRASLSVPNLSLLLRLESLYRIAVIYMWFSLRLPLCFAEREDAVQTKRECEDAIEWCLEVMRASKRRERMVRKDSQSQNPVEKHDALLVDPPLGRKDKDMQTTHLEPGEGIYEENEESPKEVPAANIAAA